MLLWDIVFRQTNGAPTQSGHLSHYLSFHYKMPSFTKEQWLTIITFVVVNFCNAMCASMQVNISIKLDKRSGIRVFVDSDKDQYPVSLRVSAYDLDMTMKSRSLWLCVLVQLYSEILTSCFNSGALLPQRGRLQGPGGLALRIGLRGFRDQCLHCQPYHWGQPEQDWS